MVGNRNVLVAAAFILVALSGCTADGASFSEPAPEWKAGYSWASDVTVEGEWTETSDGETDNGTFDEAYSEVYEILNTSQVLGGEPVYLAANSFSEFGNQLMAFRKADLSPFYVGWDACTAANCVAGLEMEMHSDHDEIPVAYQFPLSRASAWNDLIIEDEGDFQVEIAFSSKVLGYETLDTPLGEIEAIAVQRTMQIRNLQEVLNALRDEIEDEGIRVIELSGDLNVRGKEYYAPAYQFTARSVMVERSNFNLVIEMDGERFEERESFEVTYTSQLTGARLQAGPEKSLSQVLEIIQGGQAIVGPVGEAVEATGFTLEVAPVVDEVNVADGEALRYEAVLDGEVPDDVRITWSVRDLVGAEVASATGSTLDEVPNLPGVYAVVATAKAAGVSQTAFAEGIGHYRTSVNAACGLAEVNGLGVPVDCASQSIPVRPGISSLDVRATTSSPLDVVNQATIQLTDSMGNVIDARGYGDAKHLHLEAELYTNAVSAVNWDLDWYQQLGVLEDQVTFDIDLTYGGEVPFIVSFEVEPMPARDPLALPAWLQGELSFL